MAAENTTRPRSCKADEGVAPGRIVGREARAGDRDQTAAVGAGAPSAEAICRKAASAMRPIDIRHRREWRVHQHDARDDAGVEMIVDLRGVEARDGRCRERE